MKFGVQKEFVVCPAGNHKMRLASCETKEFEDRFGKSETGKVERIKWRFVSKQTDDDGTPYDFVVYTGQDYGHEKAALTRLVDMMVPGMTEAKFVNFDSDDFLNKWFELQIKHTKNEAGQPKADYVWLKPVEPTKAGGGSKTPPPGESAVAAGTPDAEDDGEDVDDPFKDE